MLPTTAVQAKRKDSTAIIVVGIITLILALGFVAVFLLLPDLMTLASSMQKETFTGGLFTSPFIGADNYAQLLQSDMLSSALWSTVQFSAAEAFTLFALALVFGYLLLACGRIRWLRHSIGTLLLLLLVVPGEIWAHAYLTLFGTEASRSLLLLAIWSAVKYVGLPALLVSASVSHGKRKATVPLLAGGIAALALFASFARLDYTFLSQMGGGVLSMDLLIYRAGLVTMRLGVGAAIGVIQSVLGFVLLAVIAFPAAIMLKRLFPAGAAADAARVKDRLFALILPVCAALAVAAALTITVAVQGVGAEALSAYAPYLIYIAIAVFGAFVSTIICFLLARPVACSGKAVRIIMTIVLLALTAAGLSAISIGEFQIIRSLGIYNTWFAVILSGIGSVWGVWPLIFAAKGLGVDSSTDWFKRMWKPSLALFAVQLMIMMNNTVPSYLYLTQAPNFHPLVTASRQMMTFSGTVGYALPALITLALPVALLLIVRTALDEKDNLALFLPGK